jgi:hypothetical protein
MATSRTLSRTVALRTASTARGPCARTSSARVSPHSTCAHPCEAAAPASNAATVGMGRATGAATGLLMMIPSDGGEGASLGR